MLTHLTARDEATDPRTESDALKPALLEGQTSPNKNKRKASADLDSIVDVIGSSSGTNRRPVNKKRKMTDKGKVAEMHVGSAKEQEAVLPVKHREEDDDDDFRAKRRDLAEVKAQKRSVECAIEDVLNRKDSTECEIRKAVEYYLDKVNGLSQFLDKLQQQQGELAHKEARLITDLSNHVSSAKFRCSQDCLEL